MNSTYWWQQQESNRLADEAYREAVREERMLRNGQCPYCCGGQVLTENSLGVPTYAVCGLCENMLRAKA